MALKHFSFDGTAVEDAVTSAIHPADVHAVIGKYMLLEALDFVIDLERSQGAYIYDAKTNRRFLDFFTCVASMPIGFNHPKMHTPEFLEKLSAAAVHKPTNSDALTAEFAEFVETFARLAKPTNFPYLFFIDGGALAVENALKAAFDWKIRKNFAKGYIEERGTQIIHFQRAFHGRSGYTLSLTNTEPAKTDLFPKFKWPRILNPAIRFPLNEDNLKAVKKAEQTAIVQIKDAIRQNKDDIAAIIIEPIQGEGGDNHFRKEFLVELRTVADENDIMLIFDEVQTGVGLTGKMWAYEHFIEPDMIAFGKKMQVCGFMCSKRVDEVPENVFKIPSRLNSTWGGNLTDMVRSQRYLEIIHEENLVENARVVGEYLLHGLLKLQMEFPAIVSNARGRGLFCAFDVRNSDERLRLRKEAYKRGLVVLGSGERSIRFRPPLNLKREEVDEGIEILSQSLRELKA
ncbi:MAG: L-lysine 6-transaminase [Ignavibacteriae bacterium]|nr:L-lysine 6-transaminase [Ignavibacteriota bacterium]